MRDPMGFRPLALGKAKDDTWIVSSETCAFELLGAEFVRDIEPGRDGDHRRQRRPQRAPVRAAAERTAASSSGSTSRAPTRPSTAARSTARASGWGAGWPLEHPVPADVVIPVPDSGVAAAIGYARESGIPYDQGLMRSHYMGRTFIEPSQQIRHFGVKLKLSPVREVLAGKRVVVVDDSIVRGTTSRKIVGMIRGAGAREVHMRISSPPTVGPCRYGIDTPTREELIASTTLAEEIRKYVGADSLGYLSLQGLYASVNGVRRDETETSGFCDACFSQQLADQHPAAGPPAAAAAHQRLGASHGRWRTRGDDRRFGRGGRRPAARRRRAGRPARASCGAGFPGPSSTATWRCCRRLGARVLVAPGAAVVGDVRLAEDVSVWYGCVLRGDLAPVTVGARTNIQDGTVLHVADDGPCAIGADVIVGHRAMLHACRVEDACLIGMQATVLDDAVIGAGSVVGAGALVTQRTVIPPRSLVLGVPARRW